MPKVFISDKSLISNKRIVFSSKYSTLRAFVRKNFRIGISNINVTQPQVYQGIDFISLNVKSANFCHCVVMVTPFEKIPPVFSKGRAVR